VKYTTPQLKRLGRLADLTLGASGAFFDGQSDNPGPNPPKPKNG
jgi:hypothetical protein